MAHLPLQLWEFTKSFSQSHIFPEPIEKLKAPVKDFLSNYWRISL